MAKQKLRLQFEFDIESIPRKEWIAMNEGHRLPGEPGRTTLYAWVTKGCPVGNGAKKLKGSDRVKLPSFRFGGRRYTTREAFLAWHAAIQGNN